FGWPNVPLASSGPHYAMATTITLASIVFCQIGIVFNCRTDRLSVFKVGLLKNKIVLIGIASELILLAILVYVPFMQEIFATAPLGWSEIAFLMIWPPIMFLLEEVRKVLVRAKQKRLLHHKLTLVKGDTK
ncbi:MAG: cation-translocating P-type ATPase C-terminal domain-containing protein, partial [Firmicutes bacterium]|nr:cation-translocating P-type ATPase C-terminal domain-containing protein [Bacillota bacterium]